MSSEHREPLGSTDQPDKNIAGPTSLSARQGQQETPTTPINSEQFGEWYYCEDSSYASGQPQAEMPSFYPADFLDYQSPEVGWQIAGKQPQPENKQRYQGQPSLSQTPQQLVQGPNGQQYPAVSTNPQVYRYPQPGYMQQPRPPAYPGGYPYQGQYSRPGSPPYPGYGAYPGYPMPPYGSYVQRSPRNSYQFTMALISLISSILLILGGFFCALAILGLNINTSLNTKSITAKELFNVNIIFAGFLCACIIGGTFGIYHSIRALIQRSSRPFRLPPFWVFLGAYAIVLVIGLFVGENAAVMNIPLLAAFLLIALNGMLPAFTFLAYTLWRLRGPSANAGLRWPTTWRRFTMALVSGATIAVVLAILLEFVLGIPLFNIQIDDLSSININDPNVVISLLILVSVIAPLAEEACKPLAVITMIGRIQNAAEAFILGMACGSGFNMIETIAYISKGDESWIIVAIERGTAGLLHGMGAGMMALGWYYLTQKNALQQRRLLIALGCMLYAVLQHAIWNGSFLLTLISGPIGNYLSTGKIVLGSYALDSYWLVYLFISALILAFLWFVTGKLQQQANTLPQRKTNQPNNQSNHQPIPVPSRFAPMPWQ